MASFFADENFRYPVVEACSEIDRDPGSRLAFTDYRESLDPFGMGRSHFVFGRRHPASVRNPTRRVDRAAS